MKGEKNHVEKNDASFISLYLQSQERTVLHKPVLWWVQQPEHSDLARADTSQSSRLCVASKGSQTVLLSKKG